MWYLYTMEFYSAAKKDEVLSVVGKWIELGNIILSEISQFQKAKGQKFSLLVECIPNTNISYNKKNRSH
jgi:hypothetical protein